MKLKIKKKPITDTFVVCDRYSNISFKEYHDKIHNYTRNQLRNIYQEVFGRPCTCSVVWAKYQISYELARQLEIKKGAFERLAKGSKFRNAYEGTMRCDLSCTGETLKTLIPFELKNYDENSQENIMKKEAKVNAMKKAAATKAANRIGLTLKKSVRDTWAYVLSNNSKTKWTDDKISEFMHKEFPDLKNKTFDQVNACRGHYNRGEYTKGIKPSKASVRYDENGEVINRFAKKAAPAPKKAESAPKTAAKAPAKKVKVTLKAKRPAPAKKVAVAA